MINDVQTSSEVARLMKDIELAYQAAASALNGPRFAASHEIIVGYQDKIGTLYQELKRSVGEGQAAQAVIDIANRTL